MQNNSEELMISLIIPAYNEEKYIGDCLECVVKNSKGKLFEIIVVDNASTDRTAEIAKSYPGVKVVREEKKGITRARQRGYLEAKGNLMAFVDADTRILPEWIDRLIKHFNENKNISCLSGPCVYYDTSKFQQFLVKVYWFLLAMPVYWITGYMVLGANFVIRRDILEKIKGFDTSIEFYGEDTNTARRAHTFGKVVFDPFFLVSSSGRRLNHHGLLKTSLLYVINFLSEVVIHKPANGKYIDIR